MTPSLQYTPNIGRRAQLQRALFGLVMLVITVAIAWILPLIGASRWWRLVLVLPAWLAFLGFIQAFRET